MTPEGALQFEGVSFIGMGWGGADPGALRVTRAVFSRGCLKPALCLKLSTGLAPISLGPVCHS